MDINKFKLDEKLEVEGVWKELGDGARVKVAASNNPAFRELFRKKTEPYTDAIRRGLLDEETSQRIMVEVMAETILIEISGFTDQGKELKSNLENKVRLLKDYRPFRDMIASIADQMENFKKKEEEKALGNSPKGSGGTSNTATA